MHFPEALHPCLFSDCGEQTGDDESPLGETSPLPFCWPGKATASRKEEEKCPWEALHPCIQLSGFLSPPPHFKAAGSRTREIKCLRAIKTLLFTPFPIFAGSRKQVFKL